jgi:hypothetical protein
MHFIATHFGYEGAMIFKNLLIFTAGAAFAFILATLVGARIILNVYFDKRAKGAALIRVNDNSEKGFTLYAYPRNMKQIIQTYCTYIVWWVRGRGCTVTFTDEKIGRTLVRFFVVLATILFVTGFWFAVQVFPSKPL